MSAIALLAIWLVAAPVRRRGERSFARVGRNGAGRLAISSSVRADLALTWPPDGPRRLWRRPLGRWLFGDRDRRRHAVHAVSRRIARRRDCARRRDRHRRGGSRDTRRRSTTRARSSSVRRHEPRRWSIGDRADHRQRWRPDERVRSTDRHAPVDATTWWPDRPDAVRACGYSSSPLAYKDRIITTAGGSSARRRVARRSHWTPRVADAGLRQRLLLAAADRSRRQAPNWWSSPSARWRGSIQTRARSTGASRTRQTSASMSRCRSGATTMCCSCRRPTMLPRRHERRGAPGGRSSNVLPGSARRCQAAGAAPDDGVAVGVADGVAPPDHGVAPRLRVGPDEVAAPDDGIAPRDVGAAPDDRAGPRRFR